MRFIKKWFPWLIFMGILLSTNLIGSILLLFGPKLYWKLTYTYTGQTLPDVYWDDLLVIIAMTLGSLLFLTVGYYLGHCVSKRFSVTKDLFPENKKNIIYFAANMLFWLSGIFSLFRLWSIVGIGGIRSWLAYNAFMEHRYMVLDALSFKEFILIYTLLPLFLGISAIWDVKGHCIKHLLLKLALLVLVNLYIFQKRPLVNAILIIAFTLFAYFFLGTAPRKQISKRLIPIVAVIVLGAYLIYLSGIFLATTERHTEVYVSATEQVNLDALQPSKQEKPDPDTSQQDRKLFRSFALEQEWLPVSSFVFTNMMAFVGLINRTAFSSICYPIVFPRYMDYYPIDFGLDILGIGTMPDDAVQVYAILNPQNPNGSTAAPFFTVLYSQGGLLVAYVGSLILGFCFGLFWGLILRGRKISPCAAALVGFALYFALSVAMAGGRDSLLSSYGAVWPVIVLCMLYGACWLISHRRRPDSSEKRICMLVTSGVLNDSRVIREATIAAESGFDTHMIGRHVPELGETNPDWPFSCHLIDIVRKEASLPARIVERTRIGLAFLKATVKLRPDIIHCNDFDTLPFGFLAAVICDSALVYDSHELWSVNGQVIESRFGSWLVKRIEGFIAPRCDAVISVSHAAGDWLQERYGLKNLEVVTNCPNIETVQHLPKEAKFELLYHGMFAPDRGCEELIGCAEEVKPYGIQIHFRGYGEWMEHYRQLARSAGADNIVFSDKVPSGEVSTAASASHVGVALTRPITKSYELTVSNKLFEYLAAGLPVILSDVPEHRYLNDKYHFGIIIEEMTAEALAQAAIRLKTDEALYQELARNAEAASKELCFEKEGQKLLRIYQEICGENAEYEAEYLHSARG